MVYPSARIQGCNFHFKQFRIISDYQSNEVLRIHLNTQQLRTILASGPSCQLSGHSTLRWSRSFSSSGRTSILSGPSDLDGALERKQLKDWWKPKRDVSRAVGIPSSGDSGHQGTESPLHEIWWGFRAVGIPSSGDSVQWGFRVHTPRNMFKFQKLEI